MPFILNYFTFDTGYRIDTPVVSSLLAGNNINIVYLFIFLTSGSGLETCNVSTCLDSSRDLHHLI